MLTQDSVNHLKAAWEKYSGEVISNEEAWEMATRIVTLHEIVAEFVDAEPVQSETATLPTVQRLESGVGSALIKISERRAAYRVTNARRGSLRSNV
jgi:hypothetical protein